MVQAAPRHLVWHGRDAVTNLRSLLPPMEKDHAATHRDTTRVKPEAYKAMLGLQSYVDAT
jgi:hypothetical protein